MQQNAWLKEQQYDCAISAASQLRWPPSLHDTVLVQHLLAGTQLFGGRFLLPGIIVKLLYARWLSGSADLAQANLSCYISVCSALGDSAFETARPFSECLCWTGTSHVIVKLAAQALCLQVRSQASS